MVDALKIKKRYSERETPVFKWEGNLKIILSIIYTNICSN